MATKKAAAGKGGAFAASVFNPENATSGGVDEVYLTCTDAIFEEFDYGGKSEYGNAIALHLYFRDDDGKEYGDDPKKDFFCFIPCGPDKDWAPVNDGKAIESITGKTGFHKSAAITFFMKNALPAGLQEFAEKIDMTVDWLIGHRAFYKFMPTGKTFTDKDGATQERSMLVPTKDWTYVDLGKGAKKAAGKASAKAAVKDDDDEGGDENTDAALDLIEAVLKTADGALSVEDLATEVYGLMTEKGTPRAERKAIQQLVQDTDWLKENAGDAYTFNAKKGTVTAA